MTTPSDDHPLLIAVFDLFRDHRPQTLSTVVDTLNVSEPVAMEALERLEQLDLLVRTRGSTSTPVWKRDLRARHNPFAIQETDELR